MIKIALTLFRFALAAVSNRIRGGLLEDLERTSEPVVFMRKIGGTGVFLITFAVLMIVDMAEISGHTAEGIAVYNFDLFLVLAATIGMYIGEAPGWGRYIGALGAWEKKKPEDFWLIDYITSWMGITPKYKAVNQNRVDYLSKRDLRVWGFVSMSLRGAYWGFMVWLCMMIYEAGRWFFGYSFELHNAWMIPGGFLMGLTYLACIEFMRLTTGKPGKGWPLAEWVFGPILIYTCFL